MKLLFDGLDNCSTAAVESLLRKNAALVAEFAADAERVSWSSIANPPAPACNLARRAGGSTLPADE